MKNIIVYIFVCLCFAACAGKDEKGKFTLNGNVKNIPSQKVFLEEMYFNEKPPLVLDTAEIKNGKFTLSAIAPEEGMYRLRFAGADMGYIFI